jgi:small subunit ribosomal protein S13
MPRIAGIDIPNEKRIDIALTYIFGIGDKVAKDILKIAKVAPNIRTKNLTSEEFKAIQAAIETLPTEGELRKIIRDNIETLKRIQAYRGIRHSMGLPVRGQRTRTNARTRKGKRKTIGAISKEAATKTETPAAVAVKK